VVTVSDIDSLLADGAGAPPALVVLGEGVEASLEPFLRPEAAWLGGVPIMACAGSAPNGDPVMVRIFGTGRDLDRHLRELLGPGEDVLIVHDDEDTRLLLREVIGERGATVRTAEDGVAGLAAMAERRPDIVLLDLMMPVMDGFEMLRRMRRDPTLSRVPVLVLTAKTLTAAEASALDASTAIPFYNPAGMTLLDGNQVIEDTLAKKDIAPGIDRVAVADLKNRAPGLRYFFGAVGVGVMVPDLAVEPGEAGCAEGFAFDQLPVTGKVQLAVKIRLFIATVRTALR